MTADTAPIVQLHASTSPRVGVQEPVDHREEVKQSPFSQCPPDTGAAVPLAENLIIDVRMGN